MKTDFNERDWLTTTQAAHQLGVSNVRVRQLEQEGKLSPIRTPLGRLFPADEVRCLVRVRANSGDRRVKRPGACFGGR